MNSTNLLYAFTIFLAVVLMLIAMMSMVHLQKIQKLETEVKLLWANTDSIKESYTVLTELYLELANANLGREVERTQ